MYPSFVIPNLRGSLFHHNPVSHPMIRVVGALYGAPAKNNHNTPAWARVLSVGARRTGRYFARLARGGLWFGYFIARFRAATGAKVARKNPHSDKRGVLRVS